MEPKIDFKDGIITYDNLFWLFNNTINDLIATIKQGIKCIYAHEHLQQ